MQGNQGGGLGFGFNPAEVPDSDNLPDGDYNVRLTGMDVKEKDNNLALSATFTVLSGNFAGRKHFERYTMRHVKREATEMGQRNLKKLFTALGFTRTLNTLQDLEAFKVFAAQRPLQVSIKNKGDFANVQKYVALQQQAAPAQAAPTAAPVAQAQPAAQAPAGGGTPWGAQPAAAPLTADQVPF